MDAELRAWTQRSVAWTQMSGAWTRRRFAWTQVSGAWTQMSKKWMGGNELRTLPDQWRTLAGRQGPRIRAAGGADRGFEDCSRARRARGPMAGVAHRPRRVVCGAAGMRGKLGQPGVSEWVLTRRRRGRRFSNGARRQRQASACDRVGFSRPGFATSLSWWFTAGIRYLHFYSSEPASAGLETASASISQASNRA